MGSVKVAMVFAVIAASLFSMGFGYWRGYDFFNAIYSGIMTWMTGKTPQSNFDGWFVAGTLGFGIFASFISITALKVET